MITLTRKSTGRFVEISPESSMRFCGTGADRYRRFCLLMLMPALTNLYDGKLTDDLSDLRTSGGEFIARAIDEWPAFLETQPHGK